MSFAVEAQLRTLSEGWKQAPSESKPEVEMTNKEGGLRDPYLVPSFFVFPSEAAKRRSGEAAKRIFYNLFYAYYIIAKRILFCWQKIN